MATPILAQGTTVTIGDGESGTATVGGVISIAGLGSGSATVIDVTTLASNNSKEKRQGLRDNGQVTLELIRNNDDSGQAELLEMWGSQATREMVITVPTSTLDIFTFNCFVTQLTTDIGSDDVVRGQCVLEITGDITLS